MFSTRFIALTGIIASIATLSLSNTVSPVNTTATSTKAGGVSSDASCVINPPLAGTFITACLSDNFTNCDSVPVVNGGCTHMPTRQINTMSSVQVPCGWVCTFFDTHFTCDPTQAVAITTLVFPGSPALALESFDKVVDYVQCSTA